jgi:hypothetical protein
MSSQPEEFAVSVGPFTKLNGELWLARRLSKHGVLGVFTGVTDSDMRRERMRTAINERELSEVICGSASGKSVTYRQAFERLYGTPL